MTCNITLLHQVRHIVLLFSVKRKADIDQLGRYR